MARIRRGVGHLRCGIGLHHGVLRNHSVGEVPVQVGADMRCLDHHVGLKLPISVPPGMRHQRAHHNHRHALGQGTTRVLCQRPPALNIEPYLVDGIPHVVLATPLTAGPQPEFTHPLVFPRLAVMRIGDKIAGHSVGMLSHDAPPHCRRRVRRRTRT